ncbi:MAG: DNA polymerase, partial [Bacilli bacterium]|nr:DNA polymerase [Bacilli bacterium]
MSAWGLHEAINISPMEANVYIDKYFNKFSRVKQFLDNTVEQAKKEGFVRTLFSRIRFLPELGSENKALIAFGERTAMNSPIQGTAADIIKMAMVEVAKKMKGLRSLLIAQVHDELVFDVAPDEIETLAQLIKMEMESVVQLLVPLVVEIGIGDNWLDT